MQWRQPRHRGSKAEGLGTGSTTKGVDMRSRLSAAAAAVVAAGVVFGGGVASAEPQPAVPTFADGLAQSRLLLELRRLAARRGLGAGARRRQRPGRHPRPHPHRRHPPGGDGGPGLSLQGAGDLRGQPVLREPRPEQRTGASITRSARRPRTRPARRRSTRPNTSPIDQHTTSSRPGCRAGSPWCTPSRSGTGHSDRLPDLRRAATRRWA